MKEHCGNIVQYQLELLGLFKSFSSSNSLIFENEINDQGVRAMQ